MQVLVLPALRDVRAGTAGHRLHHRIRHTLLPGEVVEGVPDPVREVGRPDLIRAYAARRSGMYAALIVGSAAMVGSLAWLSLQDYGDLQHEPSLAGPLVLGTAGAVAWGIGWYLYFKPHPISENEAKSLADEYNQNLRRQLGLPVVSRAPRLRELKIAPYLGAHEGGLAIAARF